MPLIIDCMKPLFTLAALVFALSMSAQQYLTRQGTITFDAGSPLEDIRATSISATAVYDKATKKLGVQALMTSFEFKRALMQEHFNESYVESERFPKTIFKGKYMDGRAVGTLTIHGVAQNVDVPATLVEENNKVILRADFSVRIADFDVRIPKTVANKIEEKAKISLDCTLSLKP